MRSAVALATIGAVVVVFASLGGLGYASSATRQVVRRLETVVQSKAATTEALPLSPAEEQSGLGPRPTPSLPGGAGGDTSGRDGREGRGDGRSSGQSAGSTTGVVGETNGQRKESELPFAGVSLLLPVGLAILLVGGGILLHRRACDLPD
jgi:hypothetical protein